MNGSKCYAYKTFKRLVYVHKHTYNIISYSHSVSVRFIERCISFCKMTTTRYGQLKQQVVTAATETVARHSSNFKPIETWTIQAIAGSNKNNNQTNSKSSRIRKRKRRRKHRNRSTDNPRTEHDNNNDDNRGSIFSKSKCKTIFNRHFKHILIVILVSFTFADMVYGKCVYVCI